MTNEQIQELLQAQIPCEELKVTGDGSHFEVLLVSEVFEGLNAVKKQQKVYAVLADAISSGDIHALTIKAFTPNEWAKNKIFHAGS